MLKEKEKDIHDIDLSDGSNGTDEEDDGDDDVENMDEFNDNGAIEGYKGRDIQLVVKPRRTLRYLLLHVCIYLLSCRPLLYERRF